MVNVYIGGLMKNGKIKTMEFKATLIIKTDEQLLPFVEEEYVNDNILVLSDKIHNKCMELLIFIRQHDNYDQNFLILSDCAELNILSIIEFNEEIYDYFDDKSVVYNKEIGKWKFHYTLEQIKED